MTTIDERVVQMRFDNSDFERNASTTIGTLEKLKEKLTFKESGKALDDFQDRANKLNFDNATKSADNFADSISAKLIAKLTIVENLVNRVTNAGVNMVKSLTVDPAVSGFNKYEQKLNSVQTIMNATGKSADDVNKYLDKLMWYTDETSYSFNDMVATVGKFTSAGQDIDKSVTSIIGIANAAGLAGAGIQNASHAMDGFSKAMGKGYMENQTWEWIRTAKMDTETLKKTLIETAAEMGTLKKNANGTYTTLKNNVVAVGDFQTALKDAWLTTDVLHAGLGKFGQYAEGVYQLYEAGMQTTDAMEALSGQFSELGEKGFRASQEAKTFADAINAVKDAVSSGWMKTYEIIFGDYEKSKELWTDLNSELYDIFAAGAETRNEVLEQWAWAGGRDQLLKSLSDSWNEIKKIAGLVKGAFEEIFPPTTALQLHQLTVGFRDFCAQFRLSSAAAYTLTGILKVLLLPIKALTIGVQVAIKILSIFAITIFKVTDLILAMMASTELTRKVFKKLFGEVQGERIFNSLSKIISNIKTGFGEVIDKVKEFKDSLSSDQAISSFVEAFRTGLNDFGNGFVEFLADSLEAIASGDWSKFFKVLKDGFGNIKKGAKDALNFVSGLIKKFLEFTGIKMPEFKGFETFTKFFDSMKEFIKQINPFKDATLDVSNVGEKFWTILKAITQAIIEFTNKINPAKILLFGFGVVMLNLVHNISTLIASAAKVTSSFAGIGDSAKGVLNALKARIDPTTKKAKDFGDVALKLAAAIVVLTASLIALSKVDPERLKSTANAMSSLILTIGGMAVVIGIINIIAGKMKASVRSLDNFAKIILALSISMVAFALAIRLIDVEDLGSAILKMVAVVGALAALGVAITLLANKTNGKSMKIATASILALAGAVYIMVKAMNAIDTERAASGVVVITILMGDLSLALLAVSKLGSDAKKAAGAAMKIAFAVGMLGLVCNMLGKMAQNNPTQLASGLLIAMVELYGMMIPLFILSAIAGKYIGAATKGFKDLTSAIAWLVIPVYLFGKMDETILTKGLSIVSTLAALFTGLTAVLTLVGFFLGNEQTYLVKGLKDFAIACTLLTLPIYLIGVGMDEEQIRKGINALGSLTIFIMALQAVASYCKVDKDSKMGIVSLVAVLGVFLVAMGILSFIDWTDLLRTTAIMTAGIAALGMSMKQMSEIDWKNGVGALMVAIGFIAMMATTFLMTKDIHDPAEALAKFGGMALVLYAMGKCAELSSELEVKDLKQAGKNIVLMLGFIGSAAVGLAMVDSWITNPDSILVKAASLAGIITVLGGVFGEDLELSEADIKQIGSNIVLMLGFVGAAAAGLAIVNFAITDPDTILTKALALCMVIQVIANAFSEDLKLEEVDWEKAKSSVLMMIGMVGTATIGLAVLNATDTDWTKSITNAAALSMTIMAVAYGMKLLGGVQIDEKVNDKLLLLVSLVGICGIVLGLLNYATTATGGNWTTSLANAAGLSLLVVAVSAAAIILSHVKRNSWQDAIGNAAAMSILVLAVSGALLIINEVKTDGLLEKVLAMGAILAGLSALTWFIGGVLGKLDIGTVFNGLLVVGEVLLGIIAIFAIIAGINELLSGGIERTLETVGNMIGNFIGSIANGYNTAASRDAETAGANMEAFMGHISTALDKLDGFGEDAKVIFDNVKYCMDQMLVICSTPGIGGSATLLEFGKNLDEFAPYIVSFVSQVADIGDARPATDAIKNMADVCNLLKTGPFDSIPDLTSFGQNLEKFTPYMTSYLEAISAADINSSTITASTNAAKAIAGFAIELGDSDTAYKMGLYSNDGEGVLTKFGRELEAFAEPIKNYANTVAGVSDWAAVENSVAAAELVAEFAKKLPKEGGVLQWWTGENKMLSTFGEELALFGPKFRAYSLIMAQVSDWTAVKDSASAAVAVAKLYNQLPTSGGVWHWLIGENKALNEFGDEIKDFAPKFIDYANQVEGISKSKVEGATEAIKNVITIYSELPTTGGWLEAIVGGTMDLSTFSEHLVSLGSALSEYNDKVKDLSFTHIEKSMDAVRWVIDISNALDDFNATNLWNLGNQLNRAGLEAVSAFGAAILSGEDDLKGAGQTMISYVKMGIINDTYKITDCGSTLTSDFATAVTQHSSDYAVQEAGRTLATKTADACYESGAFEDVAKGCIDKFILGIELKIQDMRDSIKKILHDMLDEFNTQLENNDTYSLLYLRVGKKVLDGLIKGMMDKKTVSDGVSKVCKQISDEFKKNEKKFKDIGANLIKGITKGMDAETPSVLKTSKVTIDRIINKMAETAEIHSPSVRTMKEIGMMLVAGVAKGLGKSKVAVDAARNFTQLVLNALKEGTARENGKSIGNGYLTKLIDDIASHSGNYEKRAYTIGERIAMAIHDGISSIKMGDNLDWLEQISPISAAVVNTIIADYRKSNKELEKMATEHASTMIDLFNYLNNGTQVVNIKDPSHTESDVVDLNDPRMAMMSDAYTSNLMSRAITKASTYKFMETFTNEFDELAKLNTVHNQATVQAKNKLKQLEGMLELQTETVTNAERDYVNAIVAYGSESELTTDLFVDWAYEHNKLNAYKKEIEATRDEIAKDSRADLTKGVNEFIAMTADSVAEIREMVGDEGNEMLDLIDALQEDIADGILTNPVITNAIRDKISDILGIFNDMVDMNDLNYSLEDKEYQLWEATLGLDATETEKLNKKAELIEKNLQSTAKNVRIRELEYQKIVGLLGADSKEAKEAYEELLDAQIDFAKLEQERQSIVNEIAKSQEEAADAEEESTDKLKTAREKAEEEFERWRKDGSLETWYSYGATDEELMDALIKKYEDDEASKKTKYGTETSDKDEWRASGAEVIERMNAYLDGVDMDDINNTVNTNMIALMRSWAQEYDDEMNSMAQSMASSTSSAAGTIGKAGQAAQKAFREEDVKAKHVYRNKATGEIYEADLSVEEAFKMGYMTTKGWELINDVDWEQAKADYKKKIKWVDKNAEGTLARSKNPYDVMMSKAAQQSYEEKLREQGLLGSTMTSQVDSEYMALVQDATGKLKQVWLHELQDYLAKGYTYNKESDFDDSPGYGEASDMMESYQSQFEDDLSETTEKAVKNGVTKGISSGMASVTGSFGTSGSPLSNANVDALVQQYQHEYDGAFQNFDPSSMYSGSFASGLHYVADNTNNLLDTLKDAAMEKTGQYGGQILQYISDLTGADTSIISENAPQVVETLGNITQSAGEAKDGVIELFDTFNMNYDSAGPAIDAIEAFGLATTEALEEETAEGGPLSEVFAASGLAVGNTFGLAVGEGFSNNGENIITTVDELTDYICNNLESRIGTTIQSLMARMNALSMLTGSKNASVGSIAPVYEMGASNKTATVSAKTSVTSAGAVSKQVDARVAAAMESKKSDSQNVSNVTNFTQNNYSPKALSLYDIYRNTKNQLARAKGGATT